MTMERSWQFIGIPTEREHHHASTVVLRLLDLPQPPTGRLPDSALLDTIEACGRQAVRSAILAGLGAVRARLLWHEFHRATVADYQSGVDTASTRRLARYLSLVAEEDAERARRQEQFDLALEPGV